MLQDQPEDSGHKNEEPGNGGGAPQPPTVGMDPSTCLPAGWHRIKQVRPSGNNAGQSYFTVITLDGKRIRSQKELENYVKELGLNLVISLKGPVTREVAVRRRQLKKNDDPAVK